jgi:hypothetical protein
MIFEDFHDSPQTSLLFVNLSNNQIAYRLPLHAQCPTTPTMFGNTWVKCKQTNMFSLVIKATNRPTKLLLKLRIDLILWVWRLKSDASWFLNGLWKIS